MPFWRSWAAALLGASGAAVAIPVGLVLTVVVAAGVSGGGFGGLVQLTRGPQIPGIAGRMPRVVAGLDGGLPALPLARPTVGRGRVARRALVAPRSGHRRSVAPAGRRASTRPPATPVATPSAPTTGPTVAPSVPPTPPGPTPTASTPAPPARRPNPLRELVRTLQGVVVTVPLLGQPVSDAVGSVADLILPPLPRRAAVLAAVGPRPPVAPVLAAPLP